MSAAIRASACARDSEPTGGAVRQLAIARHLSASVSLPLRIELGNAARRPHDWLDGRIPPDGAIVFGGLGVRVTLRLPSPDPSIGLAATSADITVIATDLRYEVPPGLAPAIASGPALLKLQLLDAFDEPLTGEIPIGRHREGHYELSPAFNVTLVMELEQVAVPAAEPVGARACIRPRVTFPGGIKARLWWMGRDPGSNRLSQALASVGFGVVPPGASYRLPDCPVRLGVGDAPWVWLSILDGGGRPMKREIFLGRALRDGVGEPSLAGERAAAEEWFTSDGNRVPRLGQPRGR